MWLSKLKGSINVINGQENNKIQMLLLPRVQQKKRKYSLSVSSIIKRIFTGEVTSVVNISSKVFVSSANNFHVPHSGASFTTTQPILLNVIWTTTSRDDDYTIISQPSYTSTSIITTRSIQMGEKETIIKLPNAKWRSLLGTIVDRLNPQLLNIYVY